jgi:hypothetical protein
MHFDIAGVDLLQSNPAFLEHALNVRRDLGLDALRHLIQSALVSDRVAPKRIGTVQQRVIFHIVWPLQRGIADGAQKRNSGHEVRLLGWLGSFPFAVPLAPAAPRCEFCAATNQMNRRPTLRPTSNFRDPIRH